MVVGPISLGRTGAAIACCQNRSALHGDRRLDDLSNNRRRDRVNRWECRKQPNGGIHSTDRQESLPWETVDKQDAYVIAAALAVAAARR